VCTPEECRRAQPPPRRLQLPPPPAGIARALPGPRTRPRLQGIAWRRLACAFPRAPDTTERPGSTAPRRFSRPLPTQTKTSPSPKIHPIYSVRPARTRCGGYTTTPWVTAAAPRWRWRSQVMSCVLRHTPSGKRHASCGGFARACGLGADWRPGVFLLREAIAS
jgi:hypothetical protein